MIPICDCFILLWWKGLILQAVNSKRFKQQFEKTSPKNLNLFEFVGLITETKFLSLRLVDFVLKMASSHDGTFPAACCGDESRRLVPSCVPTLIQSRISMHALCEVIIVVENTEVNRSLDDIAMRIPRSFSMNIQRDKSCLFTP